MITEERVLHVGFVLFDLALAWLSVVWALWIMVPVFLFLAFVWGYTGYLHWND